MPKFQDFNTEKYYKLWFVDILHSFPHVNFSFEVTNNTFDPDSGSYRESLVFLFSLPVIWVVLTLLVTSCCLCLQCVRKPPSKHAGSTCMRIALFIFILLSIGVMAPGFYGNEQTGKGVDNFQTSIQNTNDTITDAFNSLNTLDNLASSIQDRGVNALDMAIEKVENEGLRASLHTMANSIREKTTNARSDILSIKKKTPDVNLDFLIDGSNTFEFYRWIGTVVLLCFTLFMLLLMLIAVWKKSKCLLLTTTYFGFLSLLLVWGAAGVYLGGSVGAADLCHDPDNFVEHAASNTVERDILRVYLKCEQGTTQPKPFQDALGEAVNAVRLANTTLTSIANQSLIFDLAQLREPVRTIGVELMWANGNITHLSEDLDCRNIHKDYIKAVQAICNTSLMGLAFVLLCLPATGILMIVIQCLLPRMWRLSGKRKNVGYRPVDDTDPFCPRPPPYNGYGSIHAGAGASNSFSHDRSYSLNDPENETLPMTGPPTGSPPPAYRPTGTFINDYNLTSGPHNYSSAT